MNYFVSLQQNLEVMALNLNKNLKLYYNIGEVAKMFGLNESTLRYWEQEFPYLKPKVSGPAKIRQYSQPDKSTWFQDCGCQEDSHSEP